ncbi:MAG: hypothetical protein H0V41_01115 [Pseudonocardiales bacterium]|nr:hypothetical protein [Pseudonocardiales bacterium]
MAAVPAEVVCVGEAGASGANRAQSPHRRGGVKTKGNAKSPSKGSEKKAGKKSVSKKSVTKKSVTKK